MVGQCTKITFPTNRWIAIKNDLLADEQMQIDKRQDSACTSSMSIVLNKRNISAEEIMLLNNKNKVVLCLILIWNKTSISWQKNLVKMVYKKKIENILNFAQIIKLYKIETRKEQAYFPWASTQKSKICDNSWCSY